MLGNRGYGHALEEDVSAYYHVYVNDVDDAHYRPHYINIEQSFHTALPLVQIAVGERHALFLFQSDVCTVYDTCYV